MTTTTVFVSKSGAEHFPTIPGTLIDGLNSTPLATHRLYIVSPPIECPIFVYVHPQQYSTSVQKQYGEPISVSSSHRK